MPTPVVLLIVLQEHADNCHCQKNTQKEDNIPHTKWEQCSSKITQNFLASLSHSLKLSMIAESIRLDYKPDLRYFGYRKKLYWAVSDLEFIK